jgi:hypothetical protein
MFTIRIALSAAFGALLFIAGAGEAHAYLNPCQALGVACPPEGGSVSSTSPSTSSTPSTPSIPSYTPPPPSIPSYTPSTPPVTTPAPLPVLDIPAYVPPPATQVIPSAAQTIPTYGNLPVHGAAPLPRTGVGEWGIVLTSITTLGLLKRRWTRASQKTASF